MSDAPERIWITPEPFEGREIWDGCPLVDTIHGEGTEYVRADLHAAQIKAADELAASFSGPEGFVGFDEERARAALTAYHKSKQETT